MKHFEALRLRLSPAFGCIKNRLRQLARVILEEVSNGIIGFRLLWFQLLRGLLWIGQGQLLPFFHRLNSLDLNLIRFGVAAHQLSNP